MAIEGKESYKKWLDARHSFNTNVGFFANLLASESITKDQYTEAKALTEDLQSKVIESIKTHQVITSDIVENAFNELGTNRKPKKIASDKSQELTTSGRAYAGSFFGMSAISNT